MVVIKVSLCLFVRNRLSEPAAVVVVVVIVERRTELFEFFGDGVEVEVEVVADEFADFCVLVVSDERFCVLGVGGVDVDVGGWERVVNSMFFLFFSSLSFRRVEWMESLT